MVNQLIHMYRILLLIVQKRITHMILVISSATASGAVILDWQR